MAANVHAENITSSNVGEKKVSKLFNTAVFKMRDLGDREMSQLLRAFSALSGDQNSQDSH